MRRCFACPYNGSALAPLSAAAFRRQHTSVLERRCRRWQCTSAVVRRCPPTPAFPPFLYTPPPLLHFPQRRCLGLCCPREAHSSPVRCAWPRVPRTGSLLFLGTVLSPFVSGRQSATTDGHHRRTHHRRHLQLPPLRQAPATPNGGPHLRQPPTALQLPTQAYAAANSRHLSASGNERLTQ